MSPVTEKGIYFAKNEFYEIIRKVGGQWNDTKYRPLVALIQSSDHPEIYWAIPMGDYNHRTEEQKERIEKYVNEKDTHISSCFYHIGKTDKESIFFISDVVPITFNYIDREYLVGPKTKQAQYVIKNKNLIKELERKVGRIISFEKNFTRDKGVPKFRQRILEIHSYLVKELEAKNAPISSYITKIEVAATTNPKDPAS